jgi:hypothetical protein
MEGKELLYRDEVFAIMGAAFVIYNTVGRWSTRQLWLIAQT